MSRFLAFLLMSLVWGLTWLPTKIAAETVPPILLAAVRFIGAGACFGLFVGAAGLPLATTRPLRLVVASLLITTGCYALVFWGVARAPTGLSAIVNFSLMPVFTMLLAAAYGQEAVTRRRLGAVALGAVGVVLLFSARIGAGEDGPSVALGLGAVVLGTLCYATGAVISRPLMTEMSPIALAFWETLIGGLALLPISLLLEAPEPAHLRALLAPRAGLSLLFLVAGALTAFTIYLWLVREWGAVRAGLYSFVSPAVAIGAGVAVAGERLGPAEFGGMAAMVAAMALIASEARRPVSAA